MAKFLVHHPPPPPPQQPTWLNSGKGAKEEKVEQSTGIIWLGMTEERKLYNSVMQFTFIKHRHCDKYSGSVRFLGHHPVTTEDRRRWQQTRMNSGSILKTKGRFDY